MPSKGKSRRLLPFASMTPRMMDALIVLRDAKADGYPFIHLPDVDFRTLRALESEDRAWVFGSDGLDGTRYTITRLGERALKAYQRPPKRYDNICPECNLRSKHVTKGGRKAGYCAVCLREQGKRKRALGISSKSPDSKCPRCKKRPRHQYPNGSINTYCTHCARVLKRLNKRRNRKLRLMDIQRGILPTCIKRGCDQPCHHTEKSVYDYCLPHWRQYMTAYNDRRRPGSKAAGTRHAASTAL